MAGGVVFCFQESRFPSKYRVSLSLVHFEIGVDLCKSA